MTFNLPNGVRGSISIILNLITGAIIDSIDKILQRIVSYLQQEHVLLVVAVKEMNDVQMDTVNQQPVPLMGSV